MFLNSIIYISLFFNVILLSKQDKIKDKCKIRDMEDDVRNKEEEYEEMLQQIQNLQQEKEKYVSRIRGRV